MPNGDIEISSICSDYAAKKAKSIKDAKQEIDNSVILYHRSNFSPEEK